MATHPTTGDDEDYSSNSSWNDSYIDLYNVHRLSPNTVAILTAIFAVCVALSCVGNFVVICVMTCGKKKNKPFNSLLLNLAISDWSLGLLCLPFLFAYTMMSPEWIFGEALCVIIPFAQKTAQIVSIFTVVVIGVDRCRVVLFPLRPKLTGKHKIIIIIVIWIVAISLSSPKIAYYHYFHIPALGMGTIYICNERWPDGHSEIHVWVMFVLTYVIPFIILCLCYFMVALKLWFRTMPGQVDSRQMQEQQAANRKAVRTLVSLVILFGVCWLPLHIYNLFLITYNPEYLRTQQDATKISRASIYIWLIFADTVFNPIVYIFMSDKFRKDFGRFTCRTKRALGMQADGYTEANSNATSYTSDGERKRSGTGNYVNMRTL
ncbi:prolactin-releasing peptide receptor-like isoform X1 [Ptychodera flava]|uniref:prolactin-releasing peptide receptor-like isoform X1 n=1 Tax=Ptychodera flava TaxID=63121 RepID=UPI00396AA31E